MDIQNFKNVALIENLVPSCPGIYCIRVKNIKQFPLLFSKILANRGHNIIYLGIALDDLNSRLLKQELRAIGHGTFFRSLGAALGLKPPRSSLVNKANKYNYKFKLADQKKIIEWINKNLIVNWIKSNEDLENLETGLILKHKPLLNLKKNPAALQELRDLRAECVRIASEPSK